jgi:hypothetical protein
MRAATTVGLIALFLSACATAQRPVSEPDQVVNRIYAAYNSRNLEEFMSLFAADVEIYRPPQKLWLSGTDAVRQYYGPRFTANPNARGTSISRIVQGSYIVDRDHVTDASTRSDRTVVWIYEIRDGKIVRAWVLP